MKAHTLLLAVAMCGCQITLASSQSAPPPPNHRAEWMNQGSFGLMVHYLVRPTGNTHEERTADLNRIVDGFDVPGFLRQFQSTGADWLIFTIGQNTRYYNSPNQFLDSRKPGHTSRRDLVLEIAKGVKAAGKRFIAYLPAELAAPEELHASFGWRKDDPTQAAFQPNWIAFIRAYSLQYGKHCDGWWFDGCYEWPVFPNRNLDFAGYIAAARAGNPDAITAFNDGAFCVGKIKPVTPLEDYHAGEIHTLVQGKIALGWWNKNPRPYLPESRFVEGVQWHGLLPVDSTFCGPALPDQHYDDATLVGLLKAVKAVGGALTFNLPISQTGARNGLVPEATIAQMRRLGGAIGAKTDTAVPDAGKASFDVRAFGAVGDGKTRNTAAIQKAIDACHAAGGGRVVVPAGVFLTGSVRLKSRVVLRIEAGATLRGSPDIREYGLETAPLNWGGFCGFASHAWSPCLIYAEDAEQIGLEGPGTVDGQGGNLRKVFPNPGDTAQRRPMLVRFQHCRDVTVRDLTLLDPASFTTFFVHCQDMAIEGVTLRSRQTGNGDGLDFDGCRNVRITRCDFDCGDDAISAKTLHPDWPNEDFTITQCRMKTEWAAIRLGPESIGDMRRFMVRDCEFTDCRDGIKIESAEGAIMEDLAFHGIQMRDVNRPLYVTATRFRFSAHAKSVRPPVGRIRGLRLSDIQATARLGDPAKPYDRTCAAIVALPGRAIEEVTLSNVTFTFPGGGTAEQAGRLDVAEMLHFHDYMQWARPFDGELPASVLYLRHLRGVRLENVHFTVSKPDARPFIAGDDIDGLALQSVVGSAPAPVPGLMKLADAQRVTTRDCRIEPGDGVSLLIPPTAEEQRRLAELRQRAAALDKAIQESADAGRIHPVDLRPSK